MIYSASAANICGRGFIAAFRKPSDDIFSYFRKKQSLRNGGESLLFFRKNPIFVLKYINQDVMAKIKGSIVVDNERCKGCGVCVASCPCDVLALSSEVNGKGYPVVRMAHPEACTGCASCGVICPDSCITVYRQKIE